MNCACKLYSLTTAEWLVFDVRGIVCCIIGSVNWTRNDGLHK